jgi:hypothetical protein
MKNDRVLCINREGYEVSLTVHKTYRTIPDEDAARHGLIRVIDETEEDYLYPASHFVPAEAERDAEGQSHAAA